MFIHLSFFSTVIQFSVIATNKTRVVGCFLTNKLHLHNPRYFTLKIEHFARFDLHSNMDKYGTGHHVRLTTKLQVLKLSPQLLLHLQHVPQSANSF